MFRVLLLVGILVFVFCYGAYVIKRDKRYLRLLWQIAKYAFLLYLIGFLAVKAIRFIF